MQTIRSYDSALSKGSILSKELFASFPSQRIALGLQNPANDSADAAMISHISEQRRLSELGTVHKLKFDKLPNDGE